MIYFIYCILTAIASFILVFLIFLLWASSGKLPKKERAKGKIEIYPSKRGQEKKEKYTVLTYNIGYASGLSNNKGVREAKSFFEENIEKLVNALQKHNPDIAALQEVDFSSYRSYFMDQAKILAERLDYPYCALCVTWDKRYVPFPYWPPSVHFKRVLSGQVILCRYPISSQNCLIFKKPPNPFYYNAMYLERMAQKIQITLGEQKLQFINAHLEAFHYPTREEHARRLLDFYHESCDLPTVITGDFNSVPAKAVIRKFDDRDFTEDTTLSIIMTDPNLKEAIPSPDGNYSYPSNHPQRRLDYILGNQGIRWVQGKVDEEAGTGSDHFPMIATFEFNACHR